MKNIIFRRADTKDLKNLISIGSKEKAFLVDPEVTGFWQIKQLEKWIRSEKDALFVAEYDQKIIGFIFISHHVPTSKATIENIWTREDFRGKSVSKELLEIALTDIKQKGASYACTLVKIDNIASERLFIKMKFQKGYSFNWVHREI